MYLRKRKKNINKANLQPNILNKQFHRRGIAAPANERDVTS